MDGGRTQVYELSSKTNEERHRYYESVIKDCFAREIRYATGIHFLKSLFLNPRLFYQFVCSFRR